MKGHACAFPLNTVSTALKLPWALGEDGALLSCIVIGPRKPKLSDLKNVFRVRKQKVADLFDYLRDNCKDYPQFTIDERALNNLPDDDVPELIIRHVVFEENLTVPSLFEEETAALDKHPGFLQDAADDDDQGRTFLEHHGVIDVNGVRVPGHERTVAALQNATGAERPDLVIRHGSTFVQEYSNPGLFPGMFPTLFPWGTGGFEGQRATALSFERQARYMLDLADPCFRRHWSFIFIVANIKQRRAIHWGSRLSCKRSDHTKFTEALKALDATIIKRIADHVGRGGSLKTLLGVENRIRDLLDRCSIVNSKVPGSKAIMDLARADIRAMIGHFGIFQLFLTINPTATHSPIFHIFYGDDSVKLDTRAPLLPKANARAIRVADDPVAGSDFFHFHVYAIFQFLFGWDIRRNESTAQGGILGRIAGFFTVKEHNMRGQLHCHSVIWLAGGMNPADLRAKMKTDQEFCDRYLRFFDDIISHGHLPQPSPSGPTVPTTTTTATSINTDTDIVKQAEPPSGRSSSTFPSAAATAANLPTSLSDQSPDAPIVAEKMPESSDSARHPRQERPIPPADPAYKDVFKSDHGLLAEEVQVHQHTFTCYKGGRESCRFFFPHELNERSTFDAETNSINLRIQHPLINWHNPLLLVATRHNHDLKAVQSGKSGSAAASYITSYTTKSDETPANQISMINTVYERLANNQEHDVNAHGLLTRCVMQFGRERQLHAQAASTYVRDLGDVFQSHTTVPMLSGHLIHAVLRLFGPVLSDADEATAPIPNAAPFQTPPPASSSQGPGPDATPSQTALPTFSDPSPDPNAAPSPTVPPTSSSRPMQRNLPRLEGMGNNPDGVDEPSTASDESMADVPPPNDGDLASDSDAEDDDDTVPLSAKGLALQVDDYLHRGDTLAALSFYDFVEFVTLSPTPPKKLNIQHHKLRPSHPNVKTHVHRYTPNKAKGIPRVICRKFPKRGGDRPGDLYCCAMLAHFVPFSVHAPLKTRTVTWQTVFETTTFPPKASRIMSNWTALTECEDARDAEQLAHRRREADRAHRTETMCSSTQNDADGAGNSATADIDMEQFLRGAQQSKETTDFTAILGNTGWLDTVNLETLRSAPEDRTSFSSKNRRTWTKEQAILEAQAKANQCIPRAATGILAEQLTFDRRSEDTAPSTLSTFTASNDVSIRPPPTLQYKWRDRPPHELLQALSTERNLTPSQALAFKIAGRRFFEELNGVSTKPLRMLMHGEAGTGKTVVVRLLRELMDRYGCGHQILFMAPTGKAAAAIGGTTQHAAFRLSTHQRALTGEELEASRQAHVGTRHMFLQKTFGHVKWIFFDEVSMTSCDIFAEIEQSLRIGTQKLDEPFGGVNVLFAGDLCQLPPVAAAALYATHSTVWQNTAIRTQEELGRISWVLIDTVVEFTEQMRMQDPDIAAALSRFRTRCCTDEDVAVFNRNVLVFNSALSRTNVKARPNLIVLANTNQTVRVLNHRKAAAQASADGRRLVISHAYDKTTGTMTADLRQALLSYNGQKIKIGLGRIPLFIGMPIIYRGPNRSVPMGITNGAFGTIVAWDLTYDQFGLTIPQGVIVQFSTTATWQLSGLDPGCLPVYPTASSFEFCPTIGGSLHTITRRQLPLQPGFAMTVHSAQGVTSTGGVVVDLNKGGFRGYVAASRATRRADLFLIKEVQKQQLNCPPLPLSLTAELRRLTMLAGRTKRTHDNDTWRLSLPTIDSTSTNTTEDSSNPLRLAGEPPAKRVRRE
ncbi:hypothetical protein CF319_g5436 [Tilletia indica]|nr:hypothetical protein CF319_g5436 [Tilletia indica]